MKETNTTKESNMSNLLTRTQARYQAKSLTRTTNIKHVAIKASYVPVQSFLDDEDFGEANRVYGYMVQMRVTK